MSAEINDPNLRTRWDGIAEPGWEVNQESFQRRSRSIGCRRSVLNCAIPFAQAMRLVDFTIPNGWDFNRSLIAGVGFGSKIPAGLEGWDYVPIIRPVQQLPLLRELPRKNQMLMRSPWFQSPSQALGLGINARHLRYHHQLWRDLRPKTLRGVSTTLVFVTPQLGFSLTPHIRLHKVFDYFGALSRAAGPIQLFPAGYLYPDARLNGLEDMPASMFADVLPFLGSFIPALDTEPDPWRTLVRLGVRDCHYGYPLSRVSDPVEDFSVRNHFLCETILPSGEMVRARASESFAYATLDPALTDALRMSKDTFRDFYCLKRGVATHDGLPFFLPVEMQASVFAILLTGWELEMDQPGDLSAYTVRTQHSAIRGYNFYQRREPFFSNFMRLINEMAKQPRFESYPLATHLTYPWLGGNLHLPNQQSEGEKVLGPDFVRSYNLQQLDWSMGVFNLWNQVQFRQGMDLESQLPLDGVIFHQMRPQIRHDAHLFERPMRRASFWPDLHPSWISFDQNCDAEELPRPQER